VDEMNQEFWNESYKQDPDKAGVSDHFLQHEIESLTPGSAADLGCGVGQNALILARSTSSNSALTTIVKYGPADLQTTPGRTRQRHSF